LECSDAASQSLATVGAREPPIWSALERRFSGVVTAHIWFIWALLEDDQALVVLRGDERRQLLVHEPGQQERPELAVGACEPPAASLASGDDQRPLRGQGSSQA
jgi:hypothetical protein